MTTGRTFEEIKNTMQELYDMDIKSFIKAIISIETEITNEDELERLYTRWLENDGVTSILHESFMEYDYC